MKKLVIIGASDFQNPLILKAKEMGYETFVFAWKCGDIGEKTADHFFPISIIEKEKILEKCKEIQPDGICSIASDLATITVNYVANKLGLNANSEYCTKISTNKYKMREAFKKNGIPTPNFILIDENYNMRDLTTIKLPVIVKPVDRSGSRGVTKVENRNDLIRAINYAKSFSFNKSAIVEDYIEGDEYSCECISFHGEHHFLTITKKFTTGYPHFIETGHMEPANLSNKQEEYIKEQVFKGLNALNITDGASHTEFKIKKDGSIGIIEIGARMGGDCIGSDLVFLSTGYDFLKMVINVACNEKPDLTIVGTRNKVQINFLFNQRNILELEKRKQDYPESIIRISEIKKTSNIYDSASRWGYYIFKII